MLALAVVLSACGGSSSSTGKARTPTPTTTATPTATPTATATATATPTPEPVASGDVLFAGGLGSQQRDTELYKAATNTFAPPGTTAVMNNSRSGPTATRLINGKILIAGGFIPGPKGAPTPVASTELYDPSTDSFAAMPPTMTSAHDFGTATLLNNGKVLITGNEPSTDLYDPASNSFAAGPSMNEARPSGVAILLSNGKVLIVGGGLLGPDVTTELYDPISNAFAPPNQTPAMNVATSGPAVMDLGNGKVLIAGGVGNSGPTASTELYDEATNSFEPPASTPVMNQARAFPAIAMLNTGKVLIVGGRNPNSAGSSLASCELYDPASNTFAPANQTPTLNIVRQNLVATVLDNSVVLIEGGPDNQNNPVQQVELYDPIKNVFTLGPNTTLPQELNTATLIK